jgi:hypothetical protein
MAYLNIVCLFLWKAREKGTRYCDLEPKADKWSGVFAVGARCEPTERRRRRAGLALFEELEAVAVGVLAVEAAQAGEVVVVGHRVAGRAQPGSPGVEVLDQQAGVRFAGRAEVLLDAEVKLDAVTASASGLCLSPRAHPRSDDRGTREERRGKTPTAGARRRAGKYCVTATPFGIKVLGIGGLGRLGS